MGFFRIKVCFDPHGCGIKVDTEARAMGALISAGMHGIMVKAALRIAHDGLECELPGEGRDLMQALG